MKIFKIQNLFRCLIDCLRLSHDDREFPGICWLMHSLIVTFHYFVGMNSQNHSNHKQTSEYLEIINLKNVND